jgi:chromosome segregation ATPase
MAELETAADAEAALQTTVDALRAEVRDAIEVYTIDKDSWEQTRTQLQDRINDLESAVADVERRRDESERTRAEMQDRLRELESTAGELEHLRNRLREADLERTRVADAHEALQSRLGDARTQFDRLAEEALAMRARLGNS